MEDTLLSKMLALPIFASDPLSSVAYATEAAMVVLVAVSLARAALVLPISFAIAAMLADRRALVHADGARVRDKRRRVRRREGQPRHAAEPRRGRRAARRLHPHRRRVGRRRRPRDHFGRAVAAAVQASGSALACVLAADGRQPARRPRVRARSSRCRRTASCSRCTRCSRRASRKCAVGTCPQATCRIPSRRNRSGDAPRRSCARSRRDRPR